MSEVIYDGPFDEVEVPVPYQAPIIAKRGEPVEVPTEIARGAPAKGEPTDYDYSPGTSGLLAQDCWRTAGRAKKAAKDGEEGDGR